NAGDASAQALLGPNAEVAVGIGKNAVYLAAGKNWLEAVKKAIDDSAAAPGKATLPLELKVSLAPIAQSFAAFGDDHQKQVGQIVAGMLAQAPGRDHIKLTGEHVENGMRTRLEIENGALQAAATTAMMGRMQAAQAAQAPAQALPATAPEPAPNNQ